MECAELAALLVQAGDAERERLLRAHRPIADAQLGHLLKDICREAWGKDTGRTKGERRILRAPAAWLSYNGEVAALSAWSSGIASLAEGHMEQAVTYLDEAEERFIQVNLPHTPASTQISKLYALAVLGR